MPVTPTYPGVYVQEVPSGVRTIVGSPTSIGMFIGFANGGPVNVPVQCLNYSDFRRAFGDASQVTNLGRYLRLFFANGGTNCYVMRVANNAAASQVTLFTEAGVGNVALVLTAKQQGRLSNQMRAEVSYSTARPESTFNIELFQWEVTPTGTRLKRSLETFRNLTMDSTSPNYAVDYITQNSKLVRATVPAVPVAGTGFSQSARVLTHAATAAGMRGAVTALVGSTVAANQNFDLLIGPNAPVPVNLRTWVVPAAGADVAATRTSMANGLQTFLTNALQAKGVMTPIAVSFVDGPTPGTTSSVRISSAGNEVAIRAGSINDIAETLMIGVEQGGIEVGPFAAARPAPSGLVFRADDLVGALHPFGNARQDSVIQLNIALGGTTDTLDLIGPDTLITTAAGDKMRRDNHTGSLSANSDGIREKLDIIVSAFTALVANDPTIEWRAERWGNYRLAFVRSGAGADDENLVPLLTTAPTNFGGSFINNVRYYSLGNAGIGGFQGAGIQGDDGTAPTANDYTNAFSVVDTEVDLFNLMVLPPDATVPLESGIYGEASDFCRRRRAFLVMDPPTSWTGVQQKPAVSALRIGLAKDFSALYYPRLVTKENGRDVVVGPSGAVAGLMGRIDGTRGVWKAPAGTEATLSGVTGLEQLFTDDQNGVMNPRAVNLLRVFPNGIVSWGARTMDGDDDFGSEYKYVPIRRLALFIEETLYRNLKWVVFEPNDEPLWAQIRLNVGAFMQDLFRKGAFEGRTPKDAYFVRCDKETTTATDRNLGIVNIWVGFAPLKPAEFVIIYIQQKTAQAEV